MHATNGKHIMGIILTISKLPDEGELFTGFRYIWLRYVRWFNSD